MMTYPYGWSIIDWDVKRKTSIKVAGKTRLLIEFVWIFAWLYCLIFTYSIIDAKGSYHIGDLQKGGKIYKLYEHFLNY